MPNGPLPLDSLAAQTSPVLAFAQMSNWLSLRFRDARLGAIGLLLIVLGVMLFRLAASFGGTGPSLRRALSTLSILLLLFPPATLSAVYSLFFEKSKFYGALNVLLISIVVLLQPMAWHWLGKPAVIHPRRKNEGWLPENLLIKWRSHAGCGFNLSTVCLL